MPPLKEAHVAIEKEIRSEKAGALARAAEALEAALADLERLDAEITADRSPPRRWAELRSQLVAEAGERLWFLVIQREAMGLRRHDVVYEVLRVPPAVRRAMGPRRRG